ncbi:MAG TPA: phosphoribosylformylglycinamidine cyclo-ligase [Herpetosiphonaceae bacterium]
MTSYRDAGVDIDAKMDAISQMGAAVRSTHTPAVLAGLGAFGGCFDLRQVLADHQQPVLVASTDGVGTKTAVAAAVGRYDGLGADIVNHCINDILCQGATPLFFLDYLAAAKLDPAMIVAVVGGIAEACKAAGVALLGGETAEMPGVYHERAFDVAGTIVGVVDRAAMLDGGAVAEGDAVLALPSTGLHTNGYSLARKIAAPLGYDSAPAELGGQTLGEALLAPHRCYLREIQALRAAGVPVRGLAHITGGGIWDNLPRVLPAGLGVRIRRGSWAIPPLFGFLAAQGGLDEREQFHVFNMGLGMLVLLPANQLAAAQTLLPEAREVGSVVAVGEGEPRVGLVDG